MIVELINFSWLYSKVFLSYLEEKNKGSFYILLLYSRLSSDSIPRKLLRAQKEKSAANVHFFPTLVAMERFRSCNVWNRIQLLALERESSN